MASIAICSRLLLAFAATFFLPIIPAASGQKSPPTASISTLWTLDPSLLYNVTYPDGSAILPLLVRGRLGISYSFGFSCYVPCSSFFLSIYTVSTNSASRITNTWMASPQVVWYANRDRPVRLNSTLLFSPTGDLILHDADGFVAWSTNTSGQAATTLNLHPSGNLVLTDNQETEIWASFNHPSNSLLLGQSLIQSQKLVASSSSTNPASGMIFLTIDADGLHAFFNSDPPQQYYEMTIPGSSKAQNRYARLIFNDSALNLFASFSQQAKPDVSITLGNYSSPQFLRLEEDGHLNLYTWIANTWLVVQSVLFSFSGRCGYPSVCGQYGICLGNNCTCPQGLDGISGYFSPVNSNNMSLGCNLVTPISCQSIKSHRLVALGSVSYFIYADKSAAAMQMTDVESCKKACMTKCSCKAALFKYGANESQGSCYLPSQLFSLMSNDPEISGYNSTAFVKVQLALTTHLVPGRSPNNFTGYPGRKNKILRKRMLVGVAFGFLLAAILVVFMCTIFLVRRGRRRRSKRVKQLEEDDQFDEIPGLPTRFSYEELKDATKNFEKMIGRGGFGTVFKGTLSNGLCIAVKRLDCVGQVKRQFLSEVGIIGGIHHINLVRLIGFCVEKSYRLLVFEYVANGSLDKWIFEKSQNCTLDWQTKHNIIFDIAKGLSYLHEDCSPRIAHLDIKPQNILLDEKFNAKVGDFGLSKLIDRDHCETMTRMRGTPGYLAPEWLTSIITEKVDVYSFGVMVVEIICGRKNLDPSKPSDSVHLIALVQEKLKSNQLLDLLHTYSSDMKVHSEVVSEMMRLAIWCLQSDSSRRPSMSMVVKVLEGSTMVDSNLNYELLGGDLFI